jgi:hypothetical protein
MGDDDFGGGVLVLPVAVNVDGDAGWFHGRGLFPVATILRLHDTITQSGYLSVDGCPSACWDC